MNRRSFLKNSSLAAGLLTTTFSRFSLAEARQDQVVKPEIENNIAWFNPEQWGIEGRGWSDTKKYYDRLPARAEKTVRKAVWDLSRHSAGMMIRFATNSSVIRVRYELATQRIAMPHMPATGVSGVDLYAANDKGVLRWVNVTRPGKQQVNAVLANRIDALLQNAARKYAMYLPLYNGVNQLEIGVAKDASFKPIKPRTEKPILFYGTSIMHGACASRPGMSISSIIGRRLNKPVINLGFSGNGKMEKAVGDLICELKPGVIAVDCLPNMNAKLVAERTEPLVRQFRETFQDIPIVLVEDRSFTNSAFFKSRRDHHAASRRQLKSAYEKLKKAGVKKLHYLAGEQLLGTDGEAATDGSHPNDLGMVRYADAYEKVLKPIL